jgi:AraC-like DNA-binding protein
MGSNNAPQTCECGTDEQSLSVGYNSLLAFNFAFRDLLGMSPTPDRASFRS